MISYKNKFLLRSALPLFTLDVRVRNLGKNVYHQFSG